MWVRVMREDEMDMTVGLLTESFAESVLVPNEFVNLLGILVKQHLVESRTSMPHTATLIVFYKGEAEEELAGTVEIIFNEMGANASLTTPPSKNSPYICNMTVRKSLRRMIDAAPFNMYTKAGYSVVKTDNILIMLTLRRLKHLMHKQLPVLNSFSERDVSDSNEKQPS